MAIPAHSAAVAAAAAQAAAHTTLVHPVPLREDGADAPPRRKVARDPWSGRNKLHKEPPAQLQHDKLQHATKQTPWYTAQAMHDEFVRHGVHDNESTGAALALHGDASVVAENNQAARRQMQLVEGGAGLACCLVGNKLLHWNESESTWKLASGVGPAAAIHFGANRKMHVLQEDGMLLALDAAGRPSAGTAPLRLPADTTAFAVSPTGTVAFVGDSKPNLIGFLGSAERRQGGTTPSWGNAPAAMHDPGLASLAFRHDGTLLMLDKSGTLHHGRRQRPATGPAAAPGPAPEILEWRASEPEFERRGTNTWLTRLQVLPDGAIGATNNRQEPMHQEKPDGPWLPRAANAASAAQAFYGRFQGAPRGGWNSGGLAAPLPFGEQNWRKDKPWWKPAMFHRGHPGESLHARHGQWFKAHQPFQRTHGAWGGVKQQLRQAMAADRALLGDPADLPKLDARHALLVHPDLRNKVDGNTAEILQALTARLGIWDAQGRERAGCRNSLEYRHVQAPAHLVHSADNVLYQLHQTRVRLFGADDAQAGQLAALLEKNVFLGQDSSRQLTVRPGKVVMPSQVKVNSSTSTGASASQGVDAADLEKIWRDHGMLTLARAAATRSPTDAAAARLARDIELRVSVNTRTLLQRWQALPDAPTPADPHDPEHPMAALLATRAAQFDDHEPLLVALREVARTKEIHCQVDLGDDPAGTDLPRLLKNKFAIYTGKLLHDHAVLADAARQAGMDAGQLAARSALLDHAAPVEGAPAGLNQITQLCKSGFVNLDRVDRFLEAYNFLSGATVNPNHKVTRAMTGQGALREPLVGAYQNIVRSMSPGQSITITSSTGGGLDMEGMSQFMKFKAVPLITGLLTAQAFAIEPVNSINATRTYPLTISKNDDGGISVSIGKSTSITAMPIAVKTQHGIGIAGAPTDARLTLFGYSGLNTKIRTGLTDKTDNIASFTFAPDDYGKLDHIMAGLLGGTLSPFELMGLADGASNTRRADTAYNANFDLEPLLAGGVVGSLEEKTYHEQLKLIAAVVGQGNLAATHTRARQSTENSDGARAATRVRKTEYAAGVTGIAVLEGQVSDARNMPGGERKGYENQNKLPIAIAVASKQLYGSSLVSQGYTQHYDANGRLEEINTTLTARNAKDGDNAIRAMRDNYLNPNRHFVGGHLPQLQELLDSHAEVGPALESMIASRLPLEVTLELKPHVLEEIRHFQAGNASQEQVQQFIADKMEQPRNKRITHIGSTDANTSKTSWNTGIMALRYQSGAENTLRSPWGNINIGYPSAPHLAGRAIVELSGHALAQAPRLPDAAQIERVLRDGGPALLDFLSDPVKADPERKRWAGAAMSAMRDLRSGLAASLGDLNENQKQALAAFFPPTDPSAKMKIAAILNDSERLSMFLNGLQPQGQAVSASHTAASKAVPSRAPSGPGRLQRLLRPELEPLKQRAVTLRATIRNLRLGEAEKRLARAELAFTEERIEQELGTSALGRAFKRLAGRDVRAHALYSDTQRFSVADLGRLRDNHLLGPQVRLAAAAELAQRAARAAIPAGMVSAAAIDAGAMLEAQELHALEETLERIESLDPKRIDQLDEILAHATLLLEEEQRNAGSAALRVTDQWLRLNDVAAVPNQAIGNMRLISAMLQHASGDYDSSHLTMAAALREELQPAHPEFAEHASAPLTQAACAAALAAVRRKYPDAQFDLRLLAPDMPPRRVNGQADGAARPAVLVLDGAHGWSALRHQATPAPTDLSASDPRREQAVLALDQAVAAARPAPARASARARALAALPGQRAPQARAAAPAGPDDVRLLAQAHALQAGMARISEEHARHRRSNIFGHAFGSQRLRRDSEQAYRAITSPLVAQARTRLGASVALLDQNLERQAGARRAIDRLAQTLAMPLAPLVRQHQESERARHRNDLENALAAEGGLRQGVREAMAGMAPLHLPHMAELQASSQAHEAQR